MNTNKIKDIKAREVLDSRGNPTVQVDCILEDGSFGRATVPSGASTGKREALELRDGDKSRYMGKGVLKAVEHVNTLIKEAIVGMSPYNQADIDRVLLELDGTENKSRLGANAILGVSMSCMRAASNSMCLPLFQYIGGLNTTMLPVPLMNVINGGEHADNNLDIQEFMIVPAGAPSFSEALRMASETFHTLKSILKERGLATSVGDEGGFAPNLNSNEEAFALLVEAVEKAGYEPGKDIYIAFDAAANSFYVGEGKYRFDGKEMSNTELVDIYVELVKKFPIISIEDGMAEDDKEGWKIQFEKLGNKVQLVGDDIFVTNPKLIEDGIKDNLANSVLIKLNQIGTVTETLKAISLAHKNGWTAVVSHRSGETCDTTIADLAVGAATGMIKTGSLSRSERISKYNRLLRIEETLGKVPYYPGRAVFNPKR